MATIIADQVAPALTLEDRKAAAEVLGSLHADGGIRNAVLYDIRGHCFARFSRADGQGCLGDGGPSGDDDSRVAVSKTDVVSGGDEHLGVLVLVSSERTLASVLGEYLGGAVLILALSLGAAGGLAIVLQARISDPILAVAQVARGIAQTHQFQDRVVVNSTDELGTLASSLNTLLDEIERRDAELARRREQLEQQVIERSRAAEELKAARDRAEEATRLKSQFLANMSHEIRTPMNGILGMTELALQTDLNGEQRDYLNTVQSSTESLLRLVNEILDFSKVESGRVVISAESFDLRLALEHTVKPFLPVAARKRLEIGTKVHPDIPGLLIGDPQRLTQVLTNLVGNAIKFTEKGEISVDVRPESETRSSVDLHFSVRDTGIGISPESQAKIFEPFVQADGSVTRRYGGTGLGLAICSQLVAAMGGRIWLESRESAGSTFHFVAPFGKMDRPVSATPPAPAAVPPPAAAPACPAPRGLRILVVEDNPTNQKLVLRLLEKSGHRVTLASDGFQALEEARRNAFDLVLMDVQMPGMDGCEASREIRRGEAGSGEHLPIIALTAHAMSGDRERCLEAGMDEFVSKPIRVAELNEKIQAVIALCHH